MFKLAILGSVLLIGGVLFFPDSFEKMENMIPQEAKPINEEAKRMRDDTAVALNGKVDDTIDSLSEKVSSLKGIPVFPVKDDSTKAESEPEETQHNTTPVKDRHNIDSSVRNDTDNNKNTPMPPRSEKFAFEELSLTTKHGKTGTSVSYNDSSGKTVSVDIVMKNENKVLFSGTFHSSNFNTIVADVKDEPYFVELVIEHEEYGTLTSSTYNSGDNDNEINGIFSKS